MSELSRKIPDASPYTGLKDDLSASFFETDEQNLLEKLIDAGQIHLLSGWDPPDVNVAEKRDFMAQLALTDNSYPGGIPNYVKNAKILLEDSRNNVNPFDGCFPEQPEITNLSNIDERYSDYENTAMQKLSEIGIVLVAGGLGERLGYHGIKLDIPLEVLTNTTYLQHYAYVIKAMESRMEDKEARVPFVIMTSRDTNDETIHSLERNDYFGLSREQVIILKQELVPAVADNEGHIASAGKYNIQLKPHGHGDIHILLHTSGTAQKLYKDGIRHLLFIQDTNGQVFNAAFAAIGASIKHDYDFNSVAVNRIPGEAVGALVKLRKDKTTFTLNVEYNQLDPLLRATVSPQGDVPGENGFSMFPGNINVLVVKLESYLNVLKKSGGIIAEFVNPKYADDSRTSFKKPTRLETMMQDLPKLFGPEHKVGVTIFDRKWCFSADKNNVEEARNRYKAGGPPESAATAESDFYLANRKKVHLITGAVIRECKEELILGIPFIKGPKIILSPSFALTLDDARRKLKNITLSAEATLILNGPDISIDGLVMDGSSSLVINAVSGAKVSIEDKTISNPGFELVPLNHEEMQSANTPEYLKIRGYRFKDNGAMIRRFDKPGEYQIP